MTETIEKFIHTPEGNNKAKFNFKEMICTEGSKFKVKNAGDYDGLIVTVNHSQAKTNRSYVKQYPDRASVYYHVTASARRQSSLGDTICRSGQALTFSNNNLGPVDEE